MSILLVLVCWDRGVHRSTHDAGLGASLGAGPSRGYDRPVSGNVLRGAVRCPVTHLIGLPFASRSTIYSVNFDDATEEESTAPHRLDYPRTRGIRIFSRDAEDLARDKTQLRLHGRAVQK